MTRFVLKYFLILRRPKQHLSGSESSQKVGAGRRMGQDGPSEKIWLIAIKALRRLIQDRMQRVSTKSETKIKIWEKYSQSSISTCYISDTPSAIF